MRTSAKTYQKRMSKYHQNLWKMDPGAQQKTMLKNRPQQIEKCSKNESQLGPKKWFYFRGFASRGTFGGPIRFFTLKVGPSAPKVLPMIENWPKNDTKEPQDCEKELQKTIKKRFQMCICWGTWPGGLREALSIKRETQNKRKRDSRHTPHVLFVCVGKMIANTCKLLGGSGINQGSF